MSLSSLLASWRASVRRVRSVSVLATAGFALPVLLPAQTDTQTLAQPRVMIKAAGPELFIDGDCNNPAVWVNGMLRVYGSPYPQNGTMGGVASYKSGPSLLQLNSVTRVDPDRSALWSFSPPAFGPWFESVVADDQGVLWAYYHAEFPNPERTKVHPRIGAQVSYDQGTTWKDLGVILDTPAGTDEYHSWLGYGFSGGNGDFSVILDPQREYLYIFFSQYGRTPDTQGLAVARLRWADRAEPAGKVMKLYQGAWGEPGVGGRTSAFLQNVGDTHGKFAPFDFWWGPSIHWNTHLQRYVILLNRSNTGDFTFHNGVANWYMTGTRLDDPTSWDAPRALPFPDGYTGSWYPQVIGMGAMETDQLAGRVARLFVHGISRWEITFLRPGESDSGTTTNGAPLVNQPMPAQRFLSGSAVSISIGSEAFSDPEGEALVFSVTNLPSWLAFDSSTRTLSGTAPTVAADETIVVDLHATDPIGQKATMPIELTVARPAPVPLSVETLRPVLDLKVGEGRSDIQVAAGTSLQVVGTASDRDGDMFSHWLEIRNPSGQWSWQGWLLNEPWAGSLSGSGHLSVKNAAFTFLHEGTYTLRTTAIDESGLWSSSAEVQVHVGTSPLPRVDISVAGGANHLEVRRGARLPIGSRATDSTADLAEHWIEVCGPDGVWSWETPNQDPAYSGALNGSPAESNKRAVHAFDRVGTYLVRASAVDPANEWILSATLQVTVVE
jgi:hypothetical protein